MRKNTAQLDQFLVSMSALPASVKYTHSYSKCVIGYVLNKYRNTTQTGFLTKYSECDVYSCLKCNLSIKNDREATLPAPAKIHIHLIYELKLIDHESFCPLPHFLLFPMHNTVYSYNEFIYSVDNKFAILYRINYTLNNIK